jgi:hypothetical protein
MPKAVTREMVVLVAVACLGVVGCGGAGKEDVVVRVGDNAISAATVDHWIEIESVTAHGGARVTHAQPKGALPVPPEYTECVAYLVGHPQEGVKPTREEARVKCATEYKNYKETILGVLIDYYWSTGEGAAKGVRVSDAEVARFIKRAYPHPGELATYLKVTHESLDDERLNVRGKLMGEKLVARASQNAHSQAERLRAITKYVKDEEAKWRPRTSCKPGYVVSRCKEFRG